MAKRPLATSEMRYQRHEQGVELDEIVSDAGLHFEMLGDTQAMLRFGKDCMVTVFVDPKGRLRVTGLQDGPTDESEKVEFSIEGEGVVDAEPTPFFWEPDFDMDKWRKRRGKKK